MSPVTHASVSDRVRANTWPDVNDRLDTGVQLRLRDAAESAAPDGLTWRMAQLDREWNFDRALEAEAAVMGLLGLALGVADRRLLILPGFVAAMLVLHATHGWYPWLPLFRRVGLRTQDEIDRERYALKALRGDFSAIPADGSPAGERAAAAWKAACE